MISAGGSSDLLIIRALVRSYVATLLAPEYPEEICLVGHTPPQHCRWLVYGSVWYANWASSIRLLLRGQPSPLSLLPALPFQYVDFARWAAQLVARGYANLPRAGLLAKTTYWCPKLFLELLTDHPRPARQSFRGAIHCLSLSLPLTEALKTLSQREGCDALYGRCWLLSQVLLSRYSGQEDMCGGHACC